MSENKIDVKYIANLARIALDDEEIRTFQGQLEDVVGYVDKLKELDVENIEPTSHAHPVNNVFREDSVKEGLQSEDVLGNAPDVIQSQFKVPKIVE